MGLEVEIGFDLAGVIGQDFVHRDLIGAQMLGAFQDQHLWEARAQPFDDRRAVGIHHHLVDLRAGQQRLDDVLVERLAGQQAVILARHTLGVVAHRDEGNDFGRIQLSTLSRFWIIDWRDIPRSLFCNSFLEVRAGSKTSAAAAA